MNTIYDPQLYWNECNRDAILSDKLNIRKIKMQDYNTDHLFMLMGILNDTVSPMGDINPKIKPLIQVVKELTFRYNHGHMDEYKLDFLYSINKLPAYIKPMIILYDSMEL